jgi:hypothetical protein
LCGCFCHLVVLEQLLLEYSQPYQFVTEKIIARISKELFLRQQAQGIVLLNADLRGFWTLMALSLCWRSGRSWHESVQERHL